jgi:regulator of extracellular matrix RemA (YlzA/DUF370 family)
MVFVLKIVIPEGVPIKKTTAIREKNCPLIVALIKFGCRSVLVDGLKVVIMGAGTTGGIVSER